MVDRKITTSAIAALTFYIVSNPITYKVVDGILGKFFQIADYQGCPTGVGLIVQTVLFGVVTYAMMVAY